LKIYCGYCKYCRGFLDEYHVTFDDYKYHHECLDKFKLSVL